MRIPGRGGRRRRGWDVLALIALGGGLGSVARFGLAQAFPGRAGTFGWATFLTNTTGCLALGALMVYVLDVWPPSRYARPFLGVGFLGGFTTFSTYTVELVDLLSRGRFALADAYALSSLAAGLLATWTGVVAARLVAGHPVRRARPGPPPGPERTGAAPGTTASPAAGTATSPATSTATSAATTAAARPGQEGTRR